MNSEIKIYIECTFLLTRFRRLQIIVKTEIEVNMQFNNVIRYKLTKYIVEYSKNITYIVILIYNI